MTEREIPLERKLKILADAAKYDVACTSSGSSRRGKKGHLGNTVSAGICHTLYDKLIYALKNTSNWNRMPDALKEQVFEHLARLVAVADLSEENRIAYDKALDRYRVNQIVEEDERRKNEEMRRKAAEEGMKEGLKEGIREGIKEGMEKGMEKGEQKKQIEIARKMREDGISIDTIIKYTGLQSSDIENL